MRCFESYVPNAPLLEKLYIRHIVAFGEVTLKIFFCEGRRQAFDENTRRGHVDVDARAFSEPSTTGRVGRAQES